MSAPAGKENPAQESLGSHNPADELTQLARRIQADLTNPSPAICEPAETLAATLLANAIASRNEETANRAWFLHKVVKARAAYVRCFEQISQGQY